MAAPGKTRRRRKREQGESKAELGPSSSSLRCRGVDDGPCIWSRRPNSVGKYLPVALVSIGDERKIASPSRDADVSGFRSCRSATIRLLLAFGAAMETAPASIAPSHSIERSSEMDKDRVVGSAKELKGKVKQAIGKVVGDAKLEAEGKSDKVEGNVQNAVGAVKDAVREAVKK